MCEIENRTVVLTMMMPEKAEAPPPEPFAGEIVPLRWYYFRRTPETAWSFDPFLGCRTMMDFLAKPTLKERFSHV